MGTKKPTELAQAVRDTQNKKSVVDLVFNPETGEFIPSPHGSATEGMVVTEMTDKGYA